MERSKLRSLFKALEEREDEAIIMDLWFIDCDFWFEACSKRSKLVRSPQNHVDLWFVEIRARRQTERSKLQNLFEALEERKDEAIIMDLGSLIVISGSKFVRSPQNHVDLWLIDCDFWFGSGKKMGKVDQVEQGDENAAVKKISSNEKGEQGLLGDLQKSSAMEVVGAARRHGGCCARRVERRGSAERCASGTR
ncbi:hypothetical protein U1Q18_034045 [Sarracenia purpurea var. burkii]